MQHSLNELPSTQHLSSTPTKSHENDITKYESISLNELTPTSTNKSIQKHKSTNKDNEPSLIKKYSSIQITPKHNNNNPQYIHFNLEDLSSSSKKNSNKKRIQYASTISNFPKAAKKKDTVSPNKTANKQKKQTHNNSRSSNSQSRTHSNTINMKFITFHDINSCSNNKNKISSSNITNSNKEGKKDNKHNNVTTSPGKERSNTNRNRNSGANKNNQQNTSKRKKKVVSINIDVVENICNSNNSNNNSAGIKCEKSKSSINIQKNLSHTEGNNNNNSNNNNTKDKKDKSIVESKHKNKKNKHTTNTNTNTNNTTVPYLFTAPNQQPKSTSHKDKDKKNNNTTNNNNNNVDFLNTIPKPTNQKCATFFSNRKSHNTQQTHQNCLTITNSNNNFITNNKSGLNNSLTNSNTTNIKHHNTISTSTKATITNTASCNNLNKKNKLSFSSSMQINTFKQKMKIKVNRKDTNNESKDIINPKSNSNSNSNTLTKTSNKKTTLLTTSITPASNPENSSTKKHPKKQSTLTQQQLLSKGIPPKQIIQRYHKYLTHYELKELSKFKSQVYYLGEISKRKHNTYINLNKSFTHVNTKIRPITPMHKHNKSFSYSTTPSYLYTSMHPPFDDKEGDYIIKKGNQLNYRYELLCNLGKGSYGEAIKCYDHKTNEYVCIKIIKSHSKFYHQAIIEVNILEYISSHDTNSETNCVRFYTHFTFRNHICLVFELLDVNLYEYLKLNDYNGFNIKRIRSYTIEILFALLFLRKHKIIHCDLKPENILLLKNNKNNVKVIDFGSSCFDKEKLYFYIQSRFYRAPEIILELEYSMQIDMWSLGCILCELYTGQPIFPGEDERDQLNYIMEYLDVPPTEYINASRKRRVFFDNNNIPLKVQNSQGHIAVPNTKSLNNTLKGSGQHFIDFIKECLKWNPNERITPENALMHKFIISDMNYETLYQHKIKINRMKIGMGRNVVKSAKSSLNSNRSSNYSINKQNKNEGKRNINNNNNGNSNNNTIDKKKISVSIDKEYNKDKEKLNKIEEIGVEGIQQSRSVDKKTWRFKGKEEEDTEKKGSKGSKGKKDGKECNEKSSKMDCKGNNNGKVRNSLKQG